jgi:hypothetical protein
VYRLVQMQLPLCTFGSLRYARSSVLDTYHFEWAPAPHEQRNERFGTMALIGLGTGTEVPISQGAAVIPFSTAQLGWTRATFRHYCIEEGYSCGFDPITERPMGASIYETETRSRSLCHYAHAGL